MRRREFLRSSAAVGFAAAIPNASGWLKGISGSGTGKGARHPQAEGAAGRGDAAGDGVFVIRAHQASLRLRHHRFRHVSVTVTASSRVPMAAA